MEPLSCSWRSQIVHPLPLQFSYVWIDSTVHPHSNPPCRTISPILDTTKRILFSLLWRRTLAVLRRRQRSLCGNNDIIFVFLFEFSSASSVRDSRSYSRSFTRRTQRTGTIPCVLVKIMIPPRTRVRIQMESHSHRSRYLGVASVCSFPNPWNNGIHRRPISWILSPTLRGSLVRS